MGLKNEEVCKTLWRHHKKTHRERKSLLKWGMHTAHTLPEMKRKQLKQDPSYRKKLRLQKKEEEDKKLYKKVELEKGSSGWEGEKVRWGRGEKKWKISFSIRLLRTASSSLCEAIKEENTKCITVANELTSAEQKKYEGDATRKSPQDSIRSETRKKRKSALDALLKKKNTYRTFCLIVVPFAWVYGVKYCIKYNIFITHYELRRFRFDYILFSIHYFLEY